MGLTSRKLELVVALGAVVAYAGTVWLWPRLGGRGWRALAGRALVLLAGQVLALAAIGLAANDWGGFYSSFDDLLGTGQGGAGVFTAHANRSGPARAPVHPGDPVKVKGSKPVPLMLPGAGPHTAAGMVQRVSIRGSGTGLTEQAYVYLPPQYFQASAARRRFPVILVLTGYPGTAHNLISRMKYPTLAAQAIVRGAMQPTVLVMMRPSVAMPRDTECQDVPAGPQAETFFDVDLHQAMAAHYRVGVSGRSWAVIGDSTGGYCALKLAVRDPQAFSAAASLSGYYTAAQDSTTGNLFAGSQRLREENDLMWRLRNLPPPRVSVLVATSRQGEADYRATLAFIAAAKPPMDVASLILPSGGHNFHTWNRETPTALPWTAHHLHTPPDTPSPDTRFVR
ncbi:alpha/beta hydrolase [Streptacidiphilus carbonis]|uniref:alpha/beta hydrolase n=1 Tax=Streptacidiphilus carbonis TaxID=105422 RepID=UPI0005A75301|nr:alpha/beta hydrolase-fold protein [Streptacidiphilus carbonis]